MQNLFLRTKYFTQKFFTNTTATDRYDGGEILLSMDWSYKFSNHFYASLYVIIEVAQAELAMYFH